MRILLCLLFCTLGLFAQERIIAMTPAITEIVFALGSGDRLVGVSMYAAYPKEAQKIPVIGGYANPSLERILERAPTLVIGTNKQAAFLQQLEALGISTLALEFSTLETIKHSIEQTAVRLGKSPQKMINTIDQALIEAEKNKPSSKPKVLIIYGARLDLSRSIYIAGHHIFFEEIIQACGGVNAYTQNFPGQPVLNYEGLIATNPDIVILLYSQLTHTADKASILKLWEDVPVKASKKKKVFILDANYISIPSHRVAQTIKDICEVIAHD